MVLFCKICFSTEQKTSVDICVSTTNYSSYGNGNPATFSSNVCNAKKITSSFILLSMKAGSVSFVSFQTLKSPSGCGTRKQKRRRDTNKHGHGRAFSKVKH